MSHMDQLKTIENIRNFAFTHLSIRISICTVTQLLKTNFHF